MRRCAGMPNQLYMLPEIPPKSCITNAIKLQHTDESRCNLANLSGIVDVE